MNFIQNLKTNWKTASAGILAIVAGIVMITVDKQIVEGVGSILTGIGLILAADGGKSQEDPKPPVE